MLLTCLWTCEAWSPALMTAIERPCASTGSMAQPHSVSLLQRAVLRVWVQVKSGVFLGLWKTPFIDRVPI